MVKVPAQCLIVSGSASRELAREVARLLKLEIANCRVERFPDTEVDVELDQAVRAREVFIIQASSPPVDQNAMETCAIADACRRAGAASISWVAPYFGYARSDRRKGRRVAIMGRLTADFVQRAGIDHVMAMDLHSEQIEGFFDVPVEHVTAVAVIADALQSEIAPDSVIVSPDKGRVKMASAYATRLGCTIAVLYKERLSAKKTLVHKVAGDVRRKRCVIIDDMISTGATINSAIKALIRAGASPGFVVAASHAVFSRGARRNLNHSAIQKIIVTNSIAFSAAAWPRVKVVSVGPVLAEAIQRSLARF